MYKRQAIVNQVYVCLAAGCWKGTLRGRTERVAHRRCEVRMCGLRCGALRAEGQFHATEVDALSYLFLATDNEHWHMFSPRQAVSRLHRLRADERQCPSIDVCRPFSIGHLPAAPVSRSRRRGAIQRRALDQCGRDTSSRIPCGVLRCLLLAAALVPSSGKAKESRTRRRAR